MPWKASSVVEERTRFVLEYERGLSSMAELCRNYGVSRETRYVWLRRYANAGPQGPRYIELADPTQAQRQLLSAAPSVPLVRDFLVPAGGARLCGATGEQGKEI